MTTSTTRIDTGDDTAFDDIQSSAERRLQIYLEDTPSRSSGQEFWACIGRIVIETAGWAACIDVYGTSDPAEIGQAALAHGDIDVDGTSN